MQWSGMRQASRLVCICHPVFAGSLSACHSFVYNWKAALNIVTLFIRFLYVFIVYPCHLVLPDRSFHFRVNNSKALFAIKIQ